MLLACVVFPWKRRRLYERDPGKARSWNVECNAEVNHIKDINASVREIVGYNCKLFSQTHLSTIGSTDRDYFRDESGTRSRWISVEEGRRSCLIRGANLVAWNRRDERKPTVPYNGSGGFSGRTTGRKRERENRCMTSGGQYFRAARMRPRSLLFTETDRRSNGAAAYFDEPQSRPTAYVAFLTAAFGSGASKNATIQIDDNVLAKLSLNSVPLPRQFVNLYYCRLI